MIRTLTSCCFCLIAMLGSALAQEQIPVSGSFDYTPEVFARVPGGDSVFIDASEKEVWTGDIAGTAIAPFRMVITPDGGFDAWIEAEFEGTVLGEHEGMMTVLSRYKRPAASAHWTGEWIILRGTDELESVQGHGTAWGPGSNRENPDAGPNIFYSGTVVIPTD